MLQFDPSKSLEFFTILARGHCGMNTVSVERHAYMCETERIEFNVLMIGVDRLMKIYVGILRSM